MSYLKSWKWTDMILADRDIKRFIQIGRIKIDPIFEDTIRENGVDLRIGKTFARLKKTDRIFDEESKIEDFYEIVNSDEIIIQPHEHILMTTLEHIELSNIIIGFVNLRSTYARLGLSIPPTIIDAGFKGQLTIEVIGSEFPVKLESGQRFLHLIFARTLTPVEKPYNGKYQGQQEVTLPKFETQIEKNVKAMYRS